MLFTSADSSSSSSSCSRCTGCCRGAAPSSSSRATGSTPPGTRRSSPPRYTTTLDFTLGGGWRSKRGAAGGAPSSRSAPRQPRRPRLFQVRELPPRCPRPDARRLAGRAGPLAHHAQIPLASPSIRSRAQLHDRRLSPPDAGLPEPSRLLPVRVVLPAPRAGPVLRADSFLPQIATTVPRTPRNPGRPRARPDRPLPEVVIADNLALMWTLLRAPGAVFPPALFLASLGFVGQIYCDFAATRRWRGVRVAARLRASRNFGTPSWPAIRRDAPALAHHHGKLVPRLRVPAPGGRPRQRAVRRFQYLVTWACSLWHGANWTFVCGLCQG